MVFIGIFVVINSYICKTINEPQQPMNLKSNFYRTLLATAILSISATYTLRSQSADFNAGKYLEIQSAILRTVDSQYVDSVKLSDMLLKGINAMLASLDPYTVFIPEEDEEALELMTTGSYGGVGSLIQKLPNGNVMISEPYEGSPAVKAGLQPGDTIIAIEGVPVKDLAVEECSNRMKGVPGTDLNMTVIKGRTGDTVQVALKRERIHVSDVTYYGMLDDSTGYILIGGFTMNGAKDVRNAVETLKSDGNMKRLVLDLRGNGGGLMSEAIDIVSLFVPKNTLVMSSKGKAKGTNVEYRTETAPLDTLIPMMVLVNSGSASSSEIVAGALQDLDRATIAGTRTYGKGLVQTILPTGYNTSFKLTTAKYYTPSGRCVQAIDYSHRNEDGSVGSVPDSLKKEFKTKHGRSVYDGGGISPDITIEPGYYSRPMVSLIYSTIISDYAIRYYKSHESIAPAGEFTLTDEEYEDFVKFAAKGQFDHRTESYIEMEEVLKAFERENMAARMEGTKEELEQMLEKFSLSKEEFLIAHKDQIKPLLEDDIATKFYFIRGAAESALRQDTQLHKALEQWK